MVIPSVTTKRTRFGKEGISTPRVTQIRRTEDPEILDFRPDPVERGLYDSPNGRITTWIGRGDRKKRPRRRQDQESSRGDLAVFQEIDEKYEGQNNE